MAFGLMGAAPPDTSPLLSAQAAVDAKDPAAMIAALDNPALVDGLDPATARSVYVGLARGLAAAGRTDAALSAYAKALATGADDDPDLIEPRRAYAALLLDRNPAEAARQLSTVLSVLRSAGTDADDLVDVESLLADARSRIAPPPPPVVSVPVATAPQPSPPRGKPPKTKTRRSGAMMSAPPPPQAPPVASAPRPMSPPPMSPPPVAPAEPVKPRAPGKRDFNLVEVLYATHRRPTGSRVPSGYFGSDAAPLNFGKVVVSVPRDRRVGELPTPNAWAFEFKADPKRHFILKKVERIDTRAGFLGAVQSRVAASARKEVLVFIHGYNQSFEIAAERTAQLAVDLNLDGAPIFYSWPSQASLLGYGADAQSATDPVRLNDLANLLADIAKRTGAQRVNVVAHSMGNRYLVRALDALASRGDRQLFNEVVFAAADVGVDEFKLRWPRVRLTARRMTAYASDGDKALRASALLNGVARVGQASHPLLLPGLQTIDTTAASGGLLGHDDFSGTALDDFRAVIWLSLSPSKRCVLKPAGTAMLWRFVAGCSESDFRQAMGLIRTAGSVAAARKDLENRLLTTSGSNGDQILRLLDLLKRIAPGQLPSRARQ